MTACSQVGRCSSRGARNDVCSCFAGYQLPQNEACCSFGMLAEGLYLTCTA